ncbi:MAG: hypothetical protein A2Y38_12525 [Spirochaetes bacterium GWB1_59_5]|nr:MAG: hypothetical protein A2Y38_12525 [Spirochaetes bacterium GWB1_59_5]
MDALALASIVAVLAGAAGTVAGASWRFGAYFSIVGALFDIVFTFDFFIRLQRKTDRFSWLAFLSSVLPLGFVSGPFLAGWAFNDLGAAAVRGFWLGAQPASGLAVIAALRLLRVTRPFPILPKKKPPRESLPSGCRMAAIFGIVAVLTGAFASDALLIPGQARASEAHRAVAMSTIKASRTDAERISAARAANAMALRIFGRPLLSAPFDPFPADYAVERSEGIEAWFSVADERRARGAAAFIAALASLAATLGYATAARGGNRASRLPEPECAGGNGQDSNDGDCDKNVRKNRLRDVPAGTAELAGILGKRPR